MDFSTSKTENLFLQMIREFAEKEVKPLAAAVDEEERFPEETVKKMAALGMMGIPFPKEYGGAGGNNQLYSMAARRCHGYVLLQGLLFLHTLLCALLRFMSSAMKNNAVNICPACVPANGSELSD